MNFKKIICSALLGFILAPFLAVPALAMSYVVKPGDTLFKIGQRFGVSHNQIMSNNGLNSTVITPGMNLSIPTNSGNTHTVKAGDTLFLLSRQYNTTVNAIKSANGLQSDEIRVGQTLRMPGVTQGTTTPSRSQSTSFTQEEIELMARAVYSEARGEPYTGQVAVAAVVLNRLHDADFPNTIRGVIFQPWAFTAVHDGQFWLTPNAQAYQAVRDAINGWDPTGEALYYWNPVTATSKWIWTREIHTQIGKHVFAR